MEFPTQPQPPSQVPAHLAHMTPPNMLQRSSSTTAKGMSVIVMQRMLGLETGSYYEVERQCFEPRKSFSVAK
jgi:hypothetical protein